MPKFCSSESGFINFLQYKIGSEIVLLSDTELRRHIAVLKKLDERSFRVRNRYAFYEFLAGVHDLYIRLRRTHEAQKSAKRLAELFDIRRQRGTHPIRTIIDAASGADKKTKSRWTRALRFLWHERHEWTDFKAALRVNGGPAGCADKWAWLHPKPPRGCVRLGGEKRVPPIPLFVDRSLLAEFEGICGFSGDR